MALSLGTNCGFVTVAPTADPAGTNGGMDFASNVTKAISPSNAIRVTQMGWWCDTATQESNFEVGLYDASGAVVPGEAGALLYSSTVNAKGTTSGWKVVTGLNWVISPSTTYWLGVQLDDTVTTTYTNYSTTGGLGADAKASQTALTNPYGGGAISANYMYAVYALVETSSASTGQLLTLGVG